MDSIKQQKLHALSKFERCHHPLKGAFHILLSISFFSLFFLSYPSSWPPTANPKSFKSFLSALVSSKLSLEANRNVMFLLCNAILVFVTGGFGYFRVSSKAVEDVHGEYLARSAPYHRLVPIEDKEVIVESLVLAKNGVTDIQVEDGPQEEEEEEEDEKKAAVTGADQENHYHKHHLYQPNHHRHIRPHHQHNHYHQRQRRCQPQRKQQQQHHHRHHSQLHRLAQEEEEKNEKEDYKLQQEEQDKRGGLVVIEESDERFDNFIKQVKEGMRMEAKQLLLTA